MGHMKAPKPTTCAICGALVLCIHLQAHQVVEALHPYVPPVRVSMMREALPSEPPHTHVEYGGTARIELGGFGVNASSSATIMPLSGSAAFRGYLPVVFTTASS